MARVDSLVALAAEVAQLEARAVFLETGAASDMLRVAELEILRVAKEAAGAAPEMTAEEFAEGLAE